MNVILIGMPGAGKSTIGVLLAKALGNAFIDTDLIIQTSQNRLLAEIIEHDGAEEFSRIENEVLESVKDSDAVIATGGSAVFCESGMLSLKSTGITIYLKVPLAKLETRLDNIKTRGVVMRTGATIADIEAERAPLYEKYADITVNQTGGVEDAVEAALRAIEFARNNT